MPGGLYVWEGGGFIIPGGPLCLGVFMPGGHAWELLCLGVFMPGGHAWELLCLGVFMSGREGGL